MRCTSCECSLRPQEMISTYDNVEFLEVFCNPCLDRYVYRVDEINNKEYAHEHLTDPKSNFTSYSE